jgi:hypothetical protein
MRSRSLLVAEMMRVQDLPAGSPDPEEFSLFEKSQQLGLGIRAEVTDFIQKQGPAAGRFQKAALAGGAGTAEGAFFVTEQFAFDQVRGDGRTVDGDKRPLKVRALVVDRAGDQFLARAGLPLYQYRGVRAFGHLPDKGHDILDDIALGDETGNVGLQHLPLE